MHALPPPEALRSMTPYMNERMRKRRCFADKDLEMVMIERERQFEMAKARAAPISQSQLEVFQAGMSGGCGVLPESSLTSKPRSLLGNLSPRDFLQRIFPSHNPNVLELVWQGCGGNLERAIEQLASGIKPDSASAPAGTPASVSTGASHANPTTAHPLLQQLQHQQQSTLQQQQQLYLQAAAAAGMLGLAPGGIPLGAGMMAVRPQAFRDPRVAVLQGSPGPPSPHPSLPALPFSFPFVPAVRPAGFPSLSKSCMSGSVAGASNNSCPLARGFHPSIKRWFDNSSKSQHANSADDLVKRKSAFRSFLPAGKDDGSSNAPSSDRGSVASDRSSLSPIPNTPPSSQSQESSSDELSDSERPVQTAPIKARLKFSVESIIGNV